MQDRIGRTTFINMKRRHPLPLLYIVIICLLSITPHVRCLSDGTNNRRLRTTHDKKISSTSQLQVQQQQQHPIDTDTPRSLKGSYIDDDLAGFLDDDVIEWDDEINAPDDPVDIAQKYDYSTSTTTDDGDDDDIIEQIKDDDDDDDKSSSSRQRPPKATWYDVDVIPESVVKHDSILYDITMGFTFAAIFSLGMVIVACAANQCLTWLFCPHKLKKKKWRRRYRVEARGVGGMFIPMKDMHVYAPLSAADEEDEDIDPEDVDDDPDRLEYGMTEPEYDDDDDYSFGAKRDGRYESKEIDQAAEEYFKKEDEKDEEDESDDEKEAAQEDLLDLEAMEKKIAQSMESSRFI